MVYNTGTTLSGHPSHDTMVRYGYSDFAGAMPMKCIDEQDYDIKREISVLT